MISYFIGLNLPSPVKHQLASLCYGLPNIEWVEEENFHISLRFIGHVNDQILQDIQEALLNVAFLSFYITLQGVDHYAKKKREGIIWAGLSINEPVIQLKQEIDKVLKGLPVASNERTFKPHITIGRYNQLPSHKLGEYLMMHSLFRSEPILISRFTLFASQTTPKRSFYQQIADYSSNPLLFSD